MNTGGWGGFMFVVLRGELQAGVNLPKFISWFQLRPTTLTVRLSLLTTDEPATHPCASARLAPLPPSRFLRSTTHRWGRAAVVVVVYGSIVV